MTSSNVTKTVTDKRRKTGSLFAKIVREKICQNRVLLIFSQKFWFAIGFSLDDVRCIRAAAG
jgi:hypothetical protein